MAKKAYANDPQATIKQRRKNREKARSKADKLISEVSRAGGYAITALGALGLGLAYKATKDDKKVYSNNCLLYTSPSPRDRTRSRMPSSA